MTCESLFSFSEGLLNIASDFVEFCTTRIELGPDMGFAVIDLLFGVGIIGVITYIIIKWFVPV